MNRRALKAAFIACVLGMFFTAFDRYPYGPIELKREPDHWVIFVAIQELFVPALLAFSALLTASILVIVRLQATNEGHLSHPPGWNLRRLAEFCFSKKTFTQVLEPALSDMQKEHFEALAARRPWKARMVLIRGYWSFWSAVVAQLPIPFGRLIYKILKATKTGS